MHRRKYMARVVWTEHTSNDGDKYIGKIVFQKGKETGPNAMKFAF